MIKILAILAIALALFTIASAPYIAALLYTIVSVLQPQYVWFWAFTGISIFKISAGIAIIAWCVQIARGRMNWGIYNNGIFYGMLIMCVVIRLSDILSPFPNYSSMVSSTLVLDIYTTIFLMFFITLGLFNSEKALKYLVWALIGVTIYYTYWANSNYLQSNWTQFVNGRLEGPRGSPYRDGNIFSILFVIGLPFILFMIYHVDKTWQKVILILTVPLIWHALILCASRGAMLSAGISTLAAAWMIRSKGFNVVLLIGFVVFVIDQGGQVISRTVETIQLAENTEQEPINPRILSWQVGIQLVAKHPAFGVGPQRFLEASRFYFPGKSPHVAHNTLLNFSANTGLIAGIIYLSFFWVSRKMYKWNQKILEKHPNKLHTFINKASICALIGFFVGALFLDLIIFEPFYVLLLIIVANNFILKSKVASMTVGKKEGFVDTLQLELTRKKLNVVNT